ncbi:hypothetical protein HOL21_04365 [Candidatus Woesearchaeota archaeon]|jgi:hypothetical protein|nr:hypothetical protein [Candidatus Woesearchaeota archaeon]MBT5397421.1 hypothetical protein [Candidatus Woesearchaeota archaeon]MBT5924244.1 hypothetical protein [Candidatus Woesearchaeota archaeon]MBT6367055.1 hypothetical protein [Candidatus Woesearchaeota archaeon]MBT7762821.1 hypothetical protein [Candidatus Woesearchaeota archaeon]
MNKKAMLDDFFDLVFTVFIAVLALLLINGLLIGGLNDRDRVVNSNVRKANEASNYVVDQIERYENDDSIDSDDINRYITQIRGGEPVPIVPVHGK